MPKVSVVYVPQFLPAGVADTPDALWHDLGRHPEPGPAFTQLDTFRSNFENREDKTGSPEGYRVIKRTTKEEVVTDPRALAAETAQAAVVLTSPEVPEIVPGVREAFHEAMEEVGGPPPAS